MSSRIGLSSALARAKASVPHSYQSTCWCTADRRYGLAELARRPSDFSFTAFLPGRSMCGRAVLGVLLLNRMFGTGIFGVDRLAPGKTFILAVVETDTILSQPPAEIHFFVLEDCREIQQASVEVFHHAACRLNAVKRVLDLRNQANVLGTHSCDALIIDRNSAHHQDAVGYSVELLIEVRQLAAVFHRLDQHRLQFAARPLRLHQAEQFRFVFFVVHDCPACKGSGSKRRFPSPKPSSFGCPGNATGSILVHCTAVFQHRRSTMAFSEQRPWAPMSPCSTA